MSRPDFPSTIDSTMLKTFRECPRKFELEYLHHWKSRRPSVHLHAGAAFAASLETVRRAFYEQGKPATEALELGVIRLLTEYGPFDYPPDSAKSPAGMLGALLYYFDVFPLESDPLVPHVWAPGKSAIEFSFAVPLPFAHPVTGEPLIYTGRADLIGQMGGGLYITDEKTTTSLGAAWSSQWDMRSQFTGYCWAAGQSGLPVIGAIVRGISILKTKYEHAQCITYRPRWMIDRWLLQVTRDLTRMEAMWHEGYFDYNLDEACNGFSGCLFRRVCLAQEPAAWLEADYEQRVWDPLAHTERKLHPDPQLESPA
jgi:hypothetical protein